MSEERYSTMTLQGCKPRPLNLESISYVISNPAFHHSQFAGNLFYSRGGGEGGRKDLQMNLPNHKKPHEFILQFLEHARRNWGHMSPYFD